jgi:predicted secreted protein
MVYPVNELDFQVNTAGRTTPGTFVTVADMESFELAFDNGVEEWTPMDTEGWIRRLMTSKSIKVTLKGKRNYEDAGNDYVAGLAQVNGNAANSILKIVFPNTDSLEIPCVINVTACAGGDSTNVGALEFEALSDGKPTYTPHT